MVRTNQLQVPVSSAAPGQTRQDQAGTRSVKFHLSSPPAKRRRGTIGSVSTRSTTPAAIRHQADRLGHPSWDGPTSTDGTGGRIGHITNVAGLLTENALWPAYGKAPTARAGRHWRGPVFPWAHLGHLRVAATTGHRATSGPFRLRELASSAWPCIRPSRNIPVRQAGPYRRPLHTRRRFVGCPTRRRGVTES